MIKNIFLLTTFILSLLAYLIFYNDELPDYYSYEFLYENNSSYNESLKLHIWNKISSIFIGFDINYDIFRVLIYITELSVLLKLYFNLLESVNKYNINKYYFHFIILISFIVEFLLVRIRSGLSMLLIVVGLLSKNILISISFVLLSLLTHYETVFIIISLILILSGRLSIIKVSLSIIFILIIILNGVEYRGGNFISDLSIYRYFPYLILFSLFIIFFKKKLYIDNFFLFFLTYFITISLCSISGIIFESGEIISRITASFSVIFIYLSLKSNRNLYLYSSLSFINLLLFVRLFT